MSKTLEKNSAGEALKEYSRRSVEWAIVLKNKWGEPLFRSEVTVIILELAFAFIIVVFSYFFFSYLYDGALRTVVSGLMDSLASGQFNTGDNIVDSLQIIQAKNFILFSTILTILIAICTFLISRLTLRPAKTALDSQKRFISDIAHELRTPLSILKTNSEVALMDGELDKKIKAMIEDNIEELDRMSGIINNVLSLGSLVEPTGTGRSKFSDVDLSTVIDTSMKKLKTLAKKKGHIVTVKKLKPHIVWGNVVALEQIVTNLLRNAINYTPQGGRITIRISPDNYSNHVILSVEDTGIGISQKDLAHIFEPFYRAERSRNRHNGSTGLGLTIAKELVKMHSGSLSIKSVENKGTEAVVTLPCGRNMDNDPGAPVLSEVSINFLEDKV